VTTAQAIAAIRSELNEGFYERADAVDCMILAALTRQHSFTLGPPGTGKSLLVRAFVDRIDGARYFEQLLSKNRPDSAVLGPYDLPLLRDQGEFRRKDEGYLTAVEFAFLDEVGKASPTLGHDLLAALNERIKHEVNGKRSAIDIPLHSAFTASNELPASESEDEAALWDRLLLRCVVDYIASDADFKGLMERASAPSTTTTISYDDLVVACGEVEKVVLLDDVLDGVLRIRGDLRKLGITVSDRRWRESMKVVRAQAWLAGRAVAEVEDLYALRYTLWEDLEQKAKVERTILAVASPDADEAAGLADELAEIRATMRAKEGEAEDKLFAYIPEAMGKVNKIEKAAKKLLAKVQANGRPTRVIDTLLAQAAEIKAEGIKHLGIED
jgi:MoxR-like ATPase